MMLPGLAGIAGKGAAVSGWTPAVLTSLKAWYDADQETASDGTSLTTWTDRSGSGFNAGAVSGNEATLTYNQINGKKVLLFNAANFDYYIMSASLLAGATAGAYFAVFQRTTDPAASDIQIGPIVWRFSGSTTGGASAMPYTDGTIFDNFLTSVRKTVGNPTPALTSPRIYSAHSAASDWRAYLDGTSLFSTATNTVFAGTEQRTIGLAYNNVSDPSAGWYRFHGMIAEICIFDAVLTTGDRQKVEGYLAHKYGLTANLPVGHPYISSPP